MSETEREDRTSPDPREIERALRLIEALHGSTVGDALDVLRRALQKGERDE